MARNSAVPKHLWLVGVVSLLWNLVGAFDYTMTQTRNEAYMGKFDQAQLDYFYGFPVWFEFFWALAVWGSLVGSMLLLLRRDLAVPVFLGSFVAMLVTTIYSFGFYDGMDVMGAGGAIFSAVIFVIALLLLLYARAMRARGVLG